MDYDHERKKLEAQHLAAKLRLRREDVKRRELKRQLTATAARLKDRAEKWHRFALAFDDRQQGYTGAHAIARAYLRNMPFDEYANCVRAHSNDGKLSLLASEFAMVTRHLDKLTEYGRDDLLKRDHLSYKKEYSEWQQWQSQNPNENDWRSRKASKGQNMLIARIVDTYNIESPPLLNRSDAHDWIARRGGNPRFTDNQAASEPEGEA